MERDQGIAQEIVTPTPSGRGRYLLILALLAASFMVFQIGILRELRFQLTTIFTLAPFLFSSVLILIGLGSLAARRITGGVHGVLRWSVAILPLIPLPLFAITVLIATVFSPLQPLEVTGDQYLTSVIIAFLLVAAFGYGAVFFLQGLIFALYFREGRQMGFLSDVYAVDLLASGIGALVGGSLVFIMTPIQMVVVASSLLLLNVWLSFRFLDISLVIVVAVTVAVLGMFTAEHLGGPALRRRGRGATDVAVVDASACGRVAKVQPRAVDPAERLLLADEADPPLRASR